MFLPNGPCGVLPIPKPLNVYLGLPPIIGRFAGPGLGVNRIRESGADVYHCPDDTGGFFVAQTFIEDYGTSYRTNPFLIGQDQQQWSNQWRPLGRSERFGDSALALRHARRRDAC